MEVPSKLKHFEILNAIDVSDKIKKKKSGKEELKYLSWSRAWALVKEYYPDAQWEVERYDGLPYVHDELTGYMVFTSITIEGLTHKMCLPVIDGSNKAMKSTPYTYQTKYEEKTVNAATMFDINKAIMRCLVKNLALFGLGLYIYNDEDLPEVARIRRDKKAKEEQAKAQEARKKAEELRIQLRPIQEQILELCTDKIAKGMDREQLYKIIADNNDGEKNPKGIKTLEQAQLILEAIKKAGGNNE